MTRWRSITLNPIHGGEMESWLILSLHFHLISILHYCRIADTGLPTDLFGMASVPYGDSFLIVGGRCSVQCDPDANSKEIQQYDPDTETWIKRDEKMKSGTQYFAAVLVEDPIVVCG